MAPFLRRCILIGKTVVCNDTDKGINNKSLDYYGKKENDQITSFYLFVNEKKMMQLHC